MRRRRRYRLSDRFHRRLGPGSDYGDTRPAGRTRRKLLSRSAGPVRVGVIGTGALGRHHVRILAEDPGAELVGVFDTDRSAAERVAKE
ncbi:MAG: Gfo/Idh/MocA family oxidoreductase, partial [Thermoanaerobaculia bacterium]